MKIGTIGIGNELLQGMVDSELEVVAIARSEEPEMSADIGHRSGPSFPSSHFQVLRNPIVDAVVIHVASSDRFFLVHEALKAGKHVLVDAQLSRTLEEAEFLVKLAHSRERVLVTGHPALRSPAVDSACALLRSNEGRLRVLTSRRHWSGSRERDVDELWDRVARDLALFGRLTGAEPRWVCGMATSPDTGAALDALHLTLQYETPQGSVLGQIELGDGADPSRASIAASADGLRLDLIERTPHAIELLVKGDPLPLTARDPRVETLRRFAACVNANGTLDVREPGLIVARTLDAARRSLRDGGRPAEV